MVENWHVPSRHRTLKSPVSQESNELSWFLHAGINSGKLKVNLIVFGWAWSNMSVAL